MNHAFAAQGRAEDGSGTRTARGANGGRFCRRGDRAGASRGRRGPGRTPPPPLPTL